VILDRTNAEHGAAEMASRLGAQVQVRSEPLSGDAATVGQEFARQLVAGGRHALQCVIWSGETTVTLPPNSGRGGRCQEFALACAAELEAAGSRAAGITVLVAGTDGRDGPTDAAGAIVDASTCATIRNHAIDPAVALRDHASYDALNAAGALLKTGPTGTNVNDLVITLLS
jgi:hydroxypyruvate reductase